MPLIVLLPPSEGKSPQAGALPSFAQSHPDYAREVAPVLQQLRKVAKADRAKVYGVSTQEKADAAHRLNLAALDAPGMPALQRYTGVVYTHLDPATLPDPAYAANHVFILSGMYGLIPGHAAIADYKLPLNPWLTKHWRPINTRRLAALAEGHTVISLLPGAHAKALDYPGLVAIDFKLQGGRKSAGHFGKAIKGRFVRFLFEQRIQDLAGAARFCEDGYVFNGTDFVQA